MPVLPKPSRYVRGPVRRENKYTNPLDYLNEVVFPARDFLDELLELEKKKEKELKSAKGRVTLQKQKLQYAYDGMEKYRR